MKDPKLTLTEEEVKNSGKKKTATHDCVEQDCYAHPPDNWGISLVLLGLVFICFIYLGGLVGCYYWGKHNGEKRLKEFYVTGYDEGLKWAKKQLPKDDQVVHVDGVTYINERP